MTVLVGGLRERMIHDNCYQMVKVGLTGLGWFAAGRRHAPINLIPKPLGPQDEPSINSVAIAPTNVYGTEIEIGSGLEENTHTYYADVYAEDDSLGLHLSGDIKDILRGKFPSIGRNRPNLAVYDLRVSPAPTTPMFYCEIQNVIRDKAANTTKQWQRHWYAVRFDIVDAYDNEFDA